MPGRAKVLATLAVICAAAAIFAAKSAQPHSPPNKTGSSANTEVRKNKKRRPPPKSNPELTPSKETIAPEIIQPDEGIVAVEIIQPDDIGVRFSDIEGLESIPSDLERSVIYPLRFPERFAAGSASISPPKGVLLYGPQRQDSTILAKALAHESRATFINMTANLLEGQLSGETNKLVAAVFSLARNNQPCIIFIDEIDSFLRERNHGNHEATAMIKREFLTFWDGLASGEATRIMVLGVTSRQNDVDPEILRRMPRQFAVKLPGLILELTLANTPRAPSPSVETIPGRTEGASGPDPKES